MRTLRHLVLPLLFCIPAIVAAQSNQPTLEARLINKPLYLRGLWRNDNLRFDGLGRLTTPSETTSFTLAGMDVTRVYLQGDGLIMEGRRVGLELEQQDARTRVPIQVNGADEPIRIEITLAPGADYNHALSAIFVEDLASLVPTLPDYWQVYATNNFLAPGNQRPLHSEASEKMLDKPINKGGKESITKPTLARSVAPEITPAATNLRYKASVIISLIVEKEGVPTHLQLLRPAGLGLDEQAIAAVQKYIFRPATQKGKPVPVDLNVVVDFNGGNR
ncbi:energy transducer TonB [Granulicella arctica]|uniref:energy transducer TonB n=1 Tax=Granulicella arctica TaxID=940613 RepID=UPI0021E0878D|nr:energy transducer TonB [Granulicella arctica]